MKLRLAFVFSLLLAGCASTAPYYEPANYSKLDWAAMSFDQARAQCRSDNLQHHFMGDTYDLETPKYKACMEKNGYRFGKAEAASAGAS